MDNGLRPFVSSFKDRHGVTRFRFRRAGFSRYLPRDSEGFEREYAKCMIVAPPTPIRAPASAVGQLRALLRKRGWSGNGDFVYFIATKRMVKIGFSSTVIRRVTELAAQSPTRVRLLAVMPGGRDVEAMLHARFASDHLKGEWFRYSPAIRDAVAAIKQQEHLWTKTNQPEKVGQNEEVL